MHRFYRSSFGSFLDELFRDVFTKPSHENFLILSLGFVFAFTRHTVAQYLWRAGAASLKHFTRFDDTTTKKTGRTIEGASTYRNGVDTVRQERGDLNES